jgi:ATP-binding cassette, subfamily B, multidrug efflux pump
VSEHREGVIYDARLIRRLWAFVAPYQLWLWLSLALLLLTSAFGLARPWLLKLAIDGYIGPNQMSGFGWLLGGVALAIIGELICRALQTYTLELAGQNALIELRKAVFKHLQGLSASFFDRTPIGRLIGRVTTDIESLHEMFASGVVTILGDLINLAGILVILFWMNWKLTMVTLVVVPVLLSITLWIRIRVREAYSSMVTKRSVLNAYIHEQSTGMPLVQAFRREKRTRDRFDEINDELCDSQLESVTWESVLSAVTDLLSSITIGLILWYGGGLALEGLGIDPGEDHFSTGVTLGTLVAFLQYMDNFFGPLNDLSLKYTVMQNAMTASDRIFKLMDTEEHIPETKNPQAPDQTRGVISFKNVSFGYGDDLPVIRNLSFDVAAGERVAFVGATGAGKTTILKLLTRLYDIQEGSIELDGIDVRQYALDDLRRRVGIVPQDVFLFAGDILDNIRLGHPEISVENAARAADELHLDRVTRRMPGGYHEPVRERGANLSSGERQLIAIARVLAVAPKVLALDEATSNVDSEMEHLLQGAVTRVMENRTSLIIAHRLSTIRDVDRILVMHKGRLVEEGSHEELLARKGTYWKLHRLQYSDAAPTPTAETE